MGDILIQSLLAEISTIIRKELESGKKGNQTVKSITEILENYVVSDLPDAITLQQLKALVITWASKDSSDKFLTSKDRKQVNMLLSDIRNRCRLSSTRTKEDPEFRAEQFAKQNWEIFAGNLFEVSHVLFDKHAERQRWITDNLVTAEHLRQIIMRAETPTVVNFASFAHFCRLVNLDHVARTMRDFISETLIFFFLKHAEYTQSHRSQLLKAYPNGSYFVHLSGSSRRFGVHIKDSSIQIVKYISYEMYNDGRVKYVVDELGVFETFREALEEIKAQYHLTTIMDPSDAELWCEGWNGDGDEALHQAAVRLRSSDKGLIGSYIIALSSKGIRCYCKTSKNGFAINGEINKKGELMSSNILKFLREIQNQLDVPLKPLKLKPGKKDPYFTRPTPSTTLSFNSEQGKPSKPTSLGMLRGPPSRRTRPESQLAVATLAGKVIIPSNEVTITVPIQFEKVYSEITYHLTPLYKFAQVYLKSELKDGRFVISLADGQQNVYVNWLIRGEIPRGGRDIDNSTALLSMNLTPKTQGKGGGVSSPVASATTTTTGAIGVPIPVPSLNSSSNSPSPSPSPSSGNLPLVPREEDETEEEKKKEEDVERSSRTSDRKWKIVDDKGERKTSTCKPKIPIGSSQTAPASSASSSHAPTRIPSRPHLHSQFHRHIPLSSGNPPVRTSTTIPSTINNAPPPPPIIDTQGLINQNSQKRKFTLHDYPNPSNYNLPENADDLVNLDVQ